MRLRIHAFQYAAKASPIYSKLGQLRIRKRRRYWAHVDFAVLRLPVVCQREQHADAIQAGLIQNIVQAPKRCLVVHACSQMKATREQTLGG